MTPDLAEVTFPSAETMRCPYRYYERLRDEEPAHRLPTGEYVVSRWEDVSRVLRNPEVFSSHHSVLEDGDMRRATLEDHADQERTWGILNSDGEQHMAKRKLAFEVFKPGRLRASEPMIVEHVDRLIDGFIARRECEFVADFATQLPPMVILQLLGLPQADVPRAIGWGRFEGTGTIWASQHSRRAACEGIADLGSYIRDNVLARIDEPGDDDLSVYVQRHVEHHGEVDLPAIVADALNLFIGGILTTSHLLATMMRLFIDNPGQQELVRADRRVLMASIDEALRIDAPVQILPRLVLADTELAGTPIAGGSIVLALVGSAGRDARVFERPDAFVVSRAEVKSHLAFGLGSHFCPGAPLARMEVRAAFQRIFARMANLRFAGGRNNFVNDRSVISRGPAELFIEFDPIA